MNKYLLMFLAGLLSSLITYFVIKQDWTSIKTKGEKCNHLELIEAQEKMIELQRSYIIDQKMIIDLNNEIIKINDSIIKNYQNKSHSIITQLNQKK